MNEPYHHLEHRSGPVSGSAQRRSFWRRVERRLVRLFLPPLAHVRHRQYAGRHPAYLWVDTLLALMMFTIVGWNIYWFTNHEILPAPKVEAVITAERAIDQTGVYQITVSIRNSGDTVVTDAVWQQYPQAVRGEDGAQPIAAWPIGQLTPGQSASRQYELAIIGAPSEHGRINGRLSYASGAQNFTSLAALDFTISQPVLNITLSGPGDARSGTPYAVKAVITNPATQTVARPFIALTLPTGTRLVSTQPAAGDGLVWEWPELDAGSSQTVTATLVSDQPADKPLTATAQACLRNGNEQFQQDEAELSWRVSAPETIDTVINPPAENGAGVTLAAEARYYGTTGVQLGYGPLPPKVGQLTGYRIFWVVRSAGPDKTNLRLAAVLPPEANWVGNAANSVGQAVHYDPVRREIIWTIDQLHGDQPVATASFELAVTPDIRWLGRAMALLGVTSLTGRARDGASVTATAAALTTDLTGDTDATNGKISR